MKKSFDYMIVGSGPAGAFVANELATNGKDVLVVESGGDEIDIDYNNFIDLKNSNITGKQDFGIVQQIGGASNLWAGGLARYDPVDLLFRKNFNFPGWPLDYDELEKFYKKVDNYLNIGQGSIDYDHIDFGQIEYRLMQICLGAICFVFAESNYFSRVPAIILFTIDCLSICRIKIAIAFNYSCCDLRSTCIRNQN